jgi:hypothetical protein
MTLPRRRIALVPLVTFALAPLFWPPRAPRVDEPAPGAAAPPAPREVQIHHELVIPSTVVRERDSAIPFRSASAAAPRPPAPPRMARRAAPPDGILARARRALVGDGRHRPQPFPTPER